MSVTVSGIMINPVGEPVVNAQITLTAVTNSLTVLNAFSATVRTDGVGTYRIQLEEGSYSITVAANGRSFVYGAVTLDNTTGPSTLNQLLKQQIMESELTPDVILYFRQIQQQVANDLATIKVLEISATDAAESAGHSRDEAMLYAKDLSEALATAKGYRDQAGISADASALSQQEAAISETSAKASADSALLSEQNALSYRDSAQSAAATAADDASTLAAERTAEKIKLQVKTDADRAEAARIASEQIKSSVDDTAQTVAQQHGETTQAAIAARDSEVKATTAANSAVQSEALAAISAETARQNAGISTVDKNAAKGFRDEAEGFAQQAHASAESVGDVMPKTGGAFTGPVELAGDATEPLEPVTFQQFERTGGEFLLSVKWHMSRNYIPAGWAPADGQLLSRNLFPFALAEILSGKYPVVADDSWVFYKDWRSSFSIGDGSTTFRVPDLNGKSADSMGRVFLGGDGKSSLGEMGRIQGDASRRITGTFGGIGGQLNVSYGLVIGEAAGAFTRTGVATGRPTPSNIGEPALGELGVSFDSALVSPTAIENRPVNATGCYIIKLAGSALNDGQINALELATQITQLASRTTTLEADAFTANKIANTPWIPLTLQNGWLPLQGYHNAIYRKINGVVYVEGVITAGAWGESVVIANLPAGYRPSDDQVSVMPISGSTQGGITAQSRIALWTDGALRIYGVTGNGDIGIKSCWVI
ncbi:phage Tail Collar domain protein [Yersinia pseudotuberculosis]|nr:phage Tail Collar domain protein [Yersinia pseudotuberculosis]